MKKPVIPSEAERSRGTSNLCGQRWCGASIAEIRGQILVGLQQLDAGEGREWSMEAVEAKGRALLASRQVGE